MTEAVIIFARLPQKGKVKTRIAKTLGEKFAVDFYKACAENTFNECRKIASNNLDIYIFYADKNDKKLMKNWAGSEFRLFPQSGEDLGKRMLNAFKQVFAEGVRRAILIGTDIPGISSKVISDSLISLCKSDVVIGPAKDGGYYLIGMNKLYGFLFEKIEWGSGKVFSDTLNRISLHNIERQIVAELYDIDTEEDLKNWMSEGQEAENNKVRDFVHGYYSSIKSLII
jgi:hypothetical protein